MRLLPKAILTFACALCALLAMAQSADSSMYKKRVLESTEIDLLSSYYTQEGKHAAVTGGIGSEQLTDVAPTIVVSVPLNADDVLTIDAGVSAYTSASSGHLNPFSSGASQGAVAAVEAASPWVQSTGASASDIWWGFKLGYSHSSDNRNTIWAVHAALASEYDYGSWGFGGKVERLFNEKNTGLGLAFNVFLDKWKPRSPYELHQYMLVGGNFDQGFFKYATIYNQKGQVAADWLPLQEQLLSTENRNSFAASLSFSQLINRNAQMLLSCDIVRQQGWLANPMQRVYFADRKNYYIGNPKSIANYASTKNTDVFHLADDIERLPQTRWKWPVALRFHYFVDANISLRSYYRFYADSWGVQAHTLSLEVPLKLGTVFTVYPAYRFHAQSAADYFAPYNQLLSTATFYTSDYDLSAFNAHQYSFAVQYTDIFTSYLKIKTVQLKYSYYKRVQGLHAHIISCGIGWEL